MSDCEQFSQEAHDKWANEQIALFFWANCSFALLFTKNKWFAQQNLTKMFFWYIFCRFSEKSEWFANFLFFNEWCEQIVQVAHQKWVTMSDSFRSLTKNEQIAGLGIFSLIFWGNRWVFAKKWANQWFPLKNEWFAHFWWVTWAICSWSLIFGKRCEWIAHGHSFLVSNLSDLLTSLTFGEGPEWFAHIAH